MTLISGTAIQPSLFGAWNPARGVCHTDGNLIDSNADEDNFVLELNFKAVSLYVCLYASKHSKNPLGEPSVLEKELNHR